MGLINWIFDIYQHTQIDRARDEAVAARAEIAQLRREAAAAESGQDDLVDIDQLEDVLGELALSIKTLQRVMVQKNLVSKAEFAAILKAVDIEDGVEDGRSPL